MVVLHTTEPGKGIFILSLYHRALVFTAVKYEVAITHTNMVPWPDGLRPG